MRLPMKNGQVDDIQRLAIESDMCYYTFGTV